MNVRKYRIYILLFFILAAVLFIAELALGSVNIPIKDTVKSLFGGNIKDIWQIIIWQSRMPRAIAALLCGAALSVSGLLMQTLFRNPLADPYILGVSSGASLGVALLLLGAGTFGIVATHFGISIVLAAGIGGLAVLFIIFLVSLRVDDVMTLLIIGILLASITMAIISVLQYFGNPQAVKSLIVWGMGSLSGISYNDIIYMSIFSIVGLVAAYFISKPLDLFLLGENYARSMGQKITSMRIIIMLIAGILAACVTAYCGPIGFIGIVVPHIARMILKNNSHKYLIPLTILLGIDCLLASDLIARLPGSNLTLPINIITALLGIPLIVWIILKQHKLKGIF